MVAAEASEPRDTWRSRQMAIFTSRSAGTTPAALSLCRDTNGDGRFEVKEQIGAGSTTGVGLRNGYLYLAHPTTIERFKMTARPAN